MPGRRDVRRGNVRVDSDVSTLTTDLSHVNRSLTTAGKENVGVTGGGGVRGQINGFGSEIELVIIPPNP